MKLSNSFVAFTFAGAVSLLLSLPAFATVGAHAQLENKSGSKVTGNIDFIQNEQDLKIEYKITGLTPNSTFGFHIHEKGDCSSSDAKSAGSHFQKMSDNGGTSKDTPGMFAGDLPEIKSDSKGVAQGSVSTAKISLHGKFPISGLAIMVHEGPDDVSRPASMRVSCGIIKSTLVTK